MNRDEDIKRLREMATNASNNAYSPYSTAKIGSAVKTSDGNYFAGSNVENSSFGATVCAERVAIWTAIASGSSRIEKIYVYSKDGWPPCGMCRQVMSEFADGNLQIIIGNEKGDEKILTLEEMLPLRHTPEHMEKL